MERFTFSETSLKPQRRVQSPSAFGNACQSNHNYCAHPSGTTIALGSILFFYSFDHIPRMSILIIKSSSCHENSMINPQLIMQHDKAPRHWFWRKIEPLAKISHSNLSSFRFRQLATGLHRDQPEVYKILASRKALLFVRRIVTNFPLLRRFQLPSRESGDKNVASKCVFLIGIDCLKIKRFW